MKKQNFLNIIVVVFLFFSSCTTEQERMETRLKKFIAGYEQLVIPLYREMALTSWNANITGKDEDLAISERASFEFSRVYTDVSAFNELKMIKESGSVKDPLLIRQLELLYDAYLGNQVDTSLISERLKMETEISRKYLNFRARVNGKDLSDNEVEDILRNSRNSQELRSAGKDIK
jgi:peptidyl-dipeptidase A